MQNSVEKDKPLACLDISSKSIKLLIGDLINGKPVVLYCKELPVDGLIENDRIVDQNGLIKLIASLKKIEDNNAKLQINISEVSLLLTPSGFRVFHSEHFTNVISNMNIIADTDLNNCLSLVAKDKIPSDDAIVDIIPQKYTLENDETEYTEPPVGKQSKTIGIKAMVHTLPSSTIESIKNAVIAAGIRVKKVAVAPYCIAELNKLDPNFPTNYFLIDEGALSTHVCFVYQGTPYRCGVIHNGGDDLTNEIATAFGIGFDKAEEIKKSYGYCTRQISYNPPLAKSIDETGKTAFYYQEDLNKIIEAYFKNHFALLRNEIKTIAESVKLPNTDSPLVLVGGGASLIGEKEFFEKEFPNNRIIISRPKYPGAFNTRYNGLLGLVLTGKRYSGTLEDNYRGIPTVNRVKKEKAAKEKTDTDDSL